MFLRHPNQEQGFRSLLTFICHPRLTLLIACTLGIWWGARAALPFTWAAAQTPAVAVVSAASYTAPVAPESIAAIFGERLATRVELAPPGQSLPTQLAGTTVRVNGTPAQLFFVAPTQINCLIPAGTALGEANVVVTSGDGASSSGVARIVRVAPGLFTANADGNGVPAAVALRIKASGEQVNEPVARRDPMLNRFVPTPIIPAATGEQIFLVLFGTGLRGRPDLADLRVQVGGVAAEILYAGPQGDFAGLDQINARLPNQLAGRGLVGLTVSVNGFATANLSELEIGALPTPPLSINNFTPATVLASQDLTIDGQGFSADAKDNLVRINGSEAPVLSATATRLIVRVPFGASGGPISVRTPRNEGTSTRHLALHTSISGVIEDTRNQPLAGCRVSVRGANISALTDRNGSFLLREVGSGLQTLDVDGGAISGSLPFPRLLLKVAVVGNRDNQLAAPVALQQINGPAIPVGAASSFRRTARVQPAAGWPTRSAPDQTGRTNEVVFEVQPGATATFPDGATRGALNLTVVENNRTPVSLPANTFASVIAQITTIGTLLAPGGKLSFPNTDRLPVGATATLYRFDQNPNSPTLGSFIVSGAATVSMDGQRIETAQGAVTEMTLYFIVANRPMTTVVGRVVDGDGTAPLRQARVRCRGQEAFTDGNGGFTIRNVLAAAGDKLSVEVSFQRSNLRVDRAQRGDITPVINGVTEAPQIALPSENSNRPPVVLIPASLDLTEDDPRNITFVVGDPDANQRVVDLRIAPLPAFCRVMAGAAESYTLQCEPRSGDNGRYGLTLTATDDLGLATQRELVLRVNRPPRAISKDVTINEDTDIAIALMGEDPGGFPLSFTIASRPLNGELIGAPPNLTYRPRSNFNGTDGFTFFVNNGLSNSVGARISIFVNSVNDKPVVTPLAPQTVVTGEELRLLITASDVDTGEMLTLTAENLPAGAVFTQISPFSGRLVWTPLPQQVGSYQPIFKARDNGVPPLTSDPQTVVLSATPRWMQSPGLFGGQMFAFLSSGRMLFVGGSGGVYRSDNDGQSWTLPSRDLVNARIFSLAASGVTFFAGTDGGGVFRSLDQGQTWQQANTGLPAGAAVNALTVSGNNVFAGVTTPRGGVYRSMDQGQSWQQVLTNARVNALTGSGPDLFAAADNGVFRSTDQGQNWQIFGAGLPAQRALALALSGTMLYVGLENAGVYRTSTAMAAAAAWTPFNSPALCLTVISLAANGAELLAGTFCGVFVSGLSAPNWQARNRGLTNQIVRSLGAVGGILLIGSEGGVFRSIDLGQSWNAANAGLTGVIVNTLLVSGNDLFAGTSSDGVLRSSDLGRSWEAANQDLQSRSVPELIAIGNQLFAGADNGVFLSLDRGVAWRECTEGLPPGRYINALAVSGTTVYAGISSGNTSDPNTPGGVFIAADWAGQCRPWRNISAGLGDRDMQSLTVSGNCLYAGTERGGVFRTCNQGQSWTPITGLTHQAVHALAANSTHVFAGTGDGVWLTDNLKTSWTRISAGLPQDAFVNALLVNGNDLSAGLFGGVFTLSLFDVESSDRRQIWRAGNTDLPHSNVFSLAVNNRQFFVGVIGGGVYFNR